MSLAQRDSIELHLIDRDRCDFVLGRLEAATPRLADDEVARAAVHREPARWRAGRIALRLLLEQHCGLLVRRVPFRTAPGGRQFLDATVCDFSIADSGPWVLIGLATGGRIGVDLEQPRTLAMAPHRLALVTAAATALGQRSGSPLQCWTRIEAYTKATGPTLAAALARLGIQGHGEGRLSADDVHLRAAAARREDALAIVDLALPEALVGAAAASGAAAALLTNAAVRVHDETTIARLGG